MTNPTSQQERIAAIRATIASMRSERPRYKSHDLGFVDSVSSSLVDDWADELETAMLALTSTQAAEPSPCEWRDIATAPKPERGRRKVIDLWCVTDDHEAAQFYFGNTMCGVKDRMLWQGRVCEVYWLDGAWRPATGLRMHALTVTPTHWRPLPEDPHV